MEWALKDHAPRDVLMGRACLSPFADPDETEQFFEMLKRARVGPFAQLDDDRVATSREADGAVRR